MNVKTSAMALGAASMLAALQAAAAPIGYGAATTGGGDKAAVTVSTMAAMQAAINAYAGSGGLVLYYTGKFNYAAITDVCAQWQKPAQTVQIKNKSDVTIKGAPDSSANFGLHIVGNAHNVIVKEHDDRPAAGRRSGGLDFDRG